MNWLCALLMAASLASAAVRGRVVDATTGEPMERVRVRIATAALETQTDFAGQFEFASVADGAHELQAETVGFRLLRQTILTTANADLVVELALTPETLRRTDSVNVVAGPFDIETAPAPSRLDLTGNEIRNLGMVLMDDPIRAVHALPGVSANNDFQSRFVLRGAAFDRVGVYVDDVLIRAPFHGIANEGNASLSMLNGEMLAEMSLAPVAFGSRYGDRTGGVLDLRTREGSRTARAVRVTTGVASTGILAEGPFARGKGSWIAGARVSYLGHLVSKVSDDTALAIGFSDWQGRLTYSVTDRQVISLHVLDGVTTADRSSARDRSGVNALIDGRNRSTLAKANWQYAANERVLVSATGAWMRDRVETENRFEQPIVLAAGGEWSGTVTAAWQDGRGDAVDAGWSTRRLRSDGFSRWYLNDAGAVLDLDAHRGTALRHGAFAQRTFRAGPFRGTAGLRWDAHSYGGPSAWSPHGSGAIALGAGGELQFGWGQYVQYPDLSRFTSVFGGTRLLPERSNHYSLAWERLAGENARVRLEAWNRDDRDLVARPLFGWRLVNGRVAYGNEGRYFNSVRGYSRGVQAMVQRRSANKLSGWIGYTLSWTRQRDDLERLHYFAAEDQRHLVNAHLNYRVRPSVQLSGRWSYGSGEPIPGLFEDRSGAYWLSAARNEARLPSYRRADVRVNKSFLRDRWKLTLHGELINLSNHRNLRFVSFDRVNTRTGEVRLTIDRTFPIVPAGGLTFEF